MWGTKTRKALAASDAALARLEGQFTELQHNFTINFTSDDEASSGAFTGNPYKTYAAQVSETSKKYEGRADWGWQPTKNIIDIRAAFTIGEGVEPLIKDGESGGKEALKYIKDFLDANALDEEAAQDWAKEAEIEGKFLVRLRASTDPKDQTIRALFLPWTQHGYKVITAPEDYTQILKVTYQVSGTGRDVTLTTEEFVFASFGGRTHNVDETPTKVASVLRHIEALDKALRDWREINHLFAAPTPTFECEEKAAADALHDRLKNINWKIGKLLVFSGGTFRLVSIDAGGIESIEKEVIRNATVISGSVSIPIHFLGFPELMSNRATADSLMEVVFAGVSRERKVWKGFYDELFEKVLIMSNQTFSTGFNEKAITANLPELGQIKLAQLADVWLPIYEAQAVSLETFLERMPGIDAKVEMKRLEDERKAAMPNVLQEFMNAAGEGRGDGDEDEDEGEEE